MIELSPGWSLELERGPDWMFAKLHCPAVAPTSPLPLAETIWSLLDNSFTYRLVLELDELPLLHSQLVGEVVNLHKRIQTRGGVMRLCGLSDSNREVLRTYRLDDRFPRFDDRADAVMGPRPRQPR